MSKIVVRKFRKLSSTPITYSVPLRFYYNIPEYQLCVQNVKKTKRAYFGNATSLKCYLQSTGGVFVCLHPQIKDLPDFIIIPMIYKLHM